MRSAPPSRGPRRQWRTRRPRAARVRRSPPSRPAATPRDGAARLAPYDAARAIADRDLAMSALLDARFEAAVAAADRIHGAWLSTPEDHLLLGRARAGSGDRRALDALVRAEV